MDVSDSEGDTAAEALSPRRPCPAVATTLRKYNKKKMGEIFSMTETTKAHSVRSAEGQRLGVQQHLKGVEVYGVTKPFQNWTQKMKAHASSVESM